MPWYWFRIKRGSYMLKRKFKYLLILILCIISINLVYYITINNNYYTNKIISANISNIKNTELKLTDNNVKALQDYYNNSEIKGILSIEGLANFSYPIAQASDNDYYLNHNYNKNYDNYGSIYADYRSNLDNSKKILIYGHSSSKRVVPFNVLENYYDKNYYNQYKYMTIETETNTYRYEIFSVYIETKDFTYMNMNFDNEDSWYSHLLMLQSKSMYQIDTNLNKEDDILILQTCSNNKDYQSYKKKYLLIVLRRVK